jgi:ATP-dependent DNA ligase
MLYRDIPVEKYWSIGPKVKGAKQKLQLAIESGTYLASLKKDGEYIRAIWDNDGQIVIAGRGYEESGINLDTRLVFLVEYLKSHFKPGTCILGEIHVPGKTSTAIRAYTGSLPPKSLANQKKTPPHFYIFDCLGINGVSLMQANAEDRFRILNTLPLNENFEVAQYKNTAKGIQDLIEWAFENDEEGVVLIDKKSIPEPGKRTSWKTIKVKKELLATIDAFFTGNYTQPTRAYTGTELADWKYWENIKTGEKIFGACYNQYNEGIPVEPITKFYFMQWPGSLQVGVFKGDKIIPLCYVSGIDDNLRKQFIEDDSKVIMRPIVINGMETTDDKSIRHPKFIKFRDDILLKDCTYDKVFGED